MPGVPPDAVNTLKRAFKGLFKRGKKSGNTTTDAPPQSTTAAPVSSTSQAPAASSEAAPPQLPPIAHDSSPLQSATEPSKPLPATHPLSTGQHEETQEAVPQKHEARPGPTQPVIPAVNPSPAVQITPASPEGDIVGKQEETTGNVSPPEAGSTMDGTKSEVSALDENRPSIEEPAKEENVGEASKVEQPATVASDPQPPASSTKENIQPNGTEIAASNTTTTSTTGETPITNGVAASTTQEPTSPTNAGEEKVALMTEEPPPIKSVQTAPGMSATSGPLEDFPEGGHH